MGKRRFQKELKPNEHRDQRDLQRMLEERLCSVLTLARSDGVYMGLK